MQENPISYLLNASEYYYSYSKVTRSRQQPATDKPVKSSMIMPIALFSVRSNNDNNVANWRRLRQFERTKFAVETTGVATRTHTHCAFWCITQYKFTGIIERALRFSCRCAQPVLSVPHVCAFVCYHSFKLLSPMVVLRNCLSATLKISSLEAVPFMLCTCANSCYFTTSTYTTNKQEFWRIINISWLINCYRENSNA